MNAAGDYPWSSYLPTVGKAAAPEWLQTDWLLAQFSADRRTAQTAYARFVAEGKGLPTVWDGLREQIFLGNEDFLTHTRRHLDPGRNLTEVPRPQRRSAKPLGTYGHIHADPRHAMAEAYLSGDYTLAEIARHFAVHYSTVSRAVQEREKQTSQPADPPKTSRVRMRQNKT